MAKWEVLMASLKNLPDFAQFAIMDICPLLAIGAAAALPAYLLSRKAAKATHRFNAILNSSNAKNRTVLDGIIKFRVQGVGTTIGTMNGGLGAGVVVSAYIAIAPQPENLITQLAPVALSLGVATIGLMAFYNYIWRQSLRTLRNEIGRYAGVINVEEDLGRPKLTDRTKIDIPLKM
jgi:hypothetical protein